MLFPSLACGLALASQGPVSARQATPISSALAKRYFQEAAWASDDDNGKLWGKALYGPLMFIDNKTKYAVANQPDKEGQLHEENGVWIGHLPASFGGANTSIDWAGMHWATVIWPVPEDTVERTRILMHESFHRIQSDIGLPAPAPSPRNAHLDTRDGRIWIKMEWHALTAALMATSDAERRRAIGDALLFRAYRRSLFKGSAAEEDRMEVHEGLAEDTGIVLSGLNGDYARYIIAGRLRANESRPTYPMSFAYETGPAYGLLLDQDSSDWRKKLTTASSLSEMLQTQEGLNLPSDLKRSALDRSAMYNGPAVVQFENQREAARLAREKAYRAAFVTGPLLVIPLQHFNFVMDPNAVFPLGDNGTVLPTTHISDDWGYIDVHNGGLMSANYNRFFVSRPTSTDLLHGDGWDLHLNPGWKVVPGERKGDFTLVRSPR